jgi:hypothetical protein
MTPEFNELVGDDASGADLESLRQVHDLLLSASPPPTLSDRTSGPPRVAASNPRTRRFARFSLAAAASVALGLALGYTLGDSGSFHSQFTLPMHGLGATSAANALIRVGDADDAGNRTLEMNVRSLPALPRGGWYELYLTEHGKPVLPCGTFETTRSGTAQVTMNFPAGIATYDGWNITALRPGHPPRVELTT